MQPERGRPLQERGRPRPQNNPILTCFPESCSLVFVAGEDARVPGETPAVPKRRWPRRAIAHAPAAAFTAPPTRYQSLQIASLLELSFGRNLSNEKSLQK